MLCNTRALQGMRVHCVSTFTVQRAHGQCPSSTQPTPPAHTDNTPRQQNYAPRYPEGPALAPGNVAFIVD